MSETQLDALVVGTGFGGIYACYTLQKLDLGFNCFDNAGDVGGTWYWNEYPGAMSDTHSHLYRFSWDEGDFKTYPWSHNYLFQPEILAYLRHVVQRHDLRKYMQFNTEIVSATFDETDNLWRVTMNTGQKFAVHYLITALGLLSQPVLPDIAGLDTFKGTLVHPATWQDGIDLKNKRVALIGCGSTGVQVVTKISSEVKSLTCFMRNPQYVVPAGYKRFTHEQRQDLNNNFEGLWQTAWNSVMAFGISESKRTFQSATPEEREQVFEELWQTGNGIRFMMSGFCDITTDIEANDFAADFVRPCRGLDVQTLFGRVVEYSLMTSGIPQADPDSITGSIMSIGYLLFVSLHNRMMQIYPLSKYISFTVICWGIILTCHTACINFAGLMVVRFILGPFEGSVTAGFVLMTARWIRNDEQATRTAFWFCANGWTPILSGAFTYAVAEGFY